MNINYDCGDCPKDCGPGLVCAERINAWGTNRFYDICVPEDECGRDIVYYAYGGPPDIAFAEYVHLGSPSCTQNRYDDELSDLQSDNDDLEDEIERYQELADAADESGGTGDSSGSEEETEVPDANDIMVSVRKADPDNWEATDQATFEEITPELWEWIGHHSIRYSDMKTSSEEREAIETAGAATEGDPTLESGAATDDAPSAL